MKVKNIVFSGFAAAILVGVCGNADAAAVTFATQGYVDRQLEAKQNVLTAGEGIQITDQDVIVSTIDTSQFAKKNEIPGLMDTFATDEELEDLKTQLQNQIQELHKNGDYASAQDLESLKSAVEALQSDNVDKTVVDDLKTSVEAIAADYAKKSELTAAEERLDAAIKAIVVPTIPTLVSAFENDAGYITSAALADYAKSADVNAALSSKADASALTNLVTSTQLSELRTALEAEIAKKQNSGDYATADALQTVSDSLADLKADSYTKAQVDAKIADAISGGEIDLSGYAKQVDLDSLTQLVSGHTTEINALKNAGYQTADDVADAIETGTAGFATKSEVGAKQDKLTAGTNIEISENNTISANVDLTGLATSEELTTLQNTLQAAINEKQAAGDYAALADMTAANAAIEELKTGKADASTVATLQELVNNLGNTYATKADMTAADEALQAAIDNMDLSAYAKAADVYSKTEADAKFLIMRDENALGANLQWDEDGKLNTKGIATAEGLEDLENKVADAVTQTELDAKGYLTAESVTSGTENGTIAVNGSDVAVKGLGSAAYTTAENYIIKPTEQPNTFGEYVLILNINEAGESEGYSWLDTQDFIGGVDEW